MIERSGGKEKFLWIPHLPCTKAARTIFSDELPNEISNEIIVVGVIPYFSEKCEFLDRRVAAHPDMSIFSFGNGEFAARLSCKPVFDKICGGLGTNTLLPTVRYGEKVQMSLSALEYPFDASYNCFLLNNTLFCGKVLDETIESHTGGVKTVRMKQGYAKCSTCIVSENAAITEDKNVCKALAENGVDVLLLQKREVLLDGYDCGFIGGATFKISHGELAFFGDVKLHSAYRDIKAFCANHKVECVSLSNKPLKDYGGAVCVTEWI